MPGFMFTYAFIIPVTIVCLGSIIRAAIISERLRSSLVRHEGEVRDSMERARISLGVAIDKIVREGESRSISVPAGVGKIHTLYNLQAMELLLRVFLLAERIASLTNDPEDIAVADTARRDYEYMVHRQEIVEAVINREASVIPTSVALLAKDTPAAV